MKFAIKLKRTIPHKLTLDLIKHTPTYKYTH